MPVCYHLNNIGRALALNVRDPGFELHPGQSALLHWLLKWDNQVQGVAFESFIPTHLFMYSINKWGRIPGERMAVPPFLRCSKHMKCTSNTTSTTAAATTTTVLSADQNAVHTSKIKMYIIGKSTDYMRNVTEAS